MNKILYFEGAGMTNTSVEEGFINNCRIRTAFHLDDGRAVYLEINGGKGNKYFNPAIYRFRYTGIVDAAYYITDDKPNDDCNNHRVILPGERRSGGWVAARTFEYSEKGIRKYLKKLGASFDAIVVLPDLAGYRVFPEKKPCQGPQGYHYGDEFAYDPELTARRQVVYDKIYDIEKDDLLCDRALKEHRLPHLPGSVDYPTFSLWVDEADPGMLHLLRHFNGYNKHWTIRTDVGDTLGDWMATAKETSLGRYGC